MVLNTVISKSGQHVSNLMKKLWISREENFKSLKARAILLGYAQSYAHVFANKYSGLCAFPNAIRQYNNKPNNNFIVLERT